MKRIIFALIVTACFSSCTNKKNTISFGYFECLKPGKNEKQIQITKVQLDFYKKHLAGDSGSLILNRVISAGERYTYISMSTADTPELINQHMQTDSSIKIFNTKKFDEAGKSYTSYFFKKENYYINRIAYNETQVKNMIVFDYLGNDSSTIAIFYKNHNLFADKINCSDNK